MNEKNPLAIPRQKIDAIDTQIIALLEERMTAVAEVIRIKKEEKIAILDTGREADVLENVRKRVENQKYADTIVATFEDIMRQSRHYQNQQLED
ncbi:chorismate mutase [Enterococcus eurekensis]|uniref:Chorismate mutase n=2 Tax=Enterococcus TaxID=1350 RepID=A0ABV9M3A1_9ENTE|nr:chorismate mutase [Candidatus Enterococcus avicola]